MHFSDWMFLKYQNESNRFGVLSRIVASDSNFPRTSLDEKILRRRLIELKVDLPTMRAFNNAYHRYTKQRTRL